MIDALTAFINDTGWLAPLYYVASFVLTALLPVIPTPLVAALGGTAFGFGPAVAYGLLGMGIGAYISLKLARSVGRPLIQRLVKPDVWATWEEFLGIRSPVAWGIIFFVLNLDFAVMAAGLASLPVYHLWLAAMVARTPWLLASAWFGDAILVNDTVALLMALLMIPGLYILGKVRPILQRWLLRLQKKPESAPVAAAGASLQTPTVAPSEVPQARIEDVANGITEQVEAHN